MALRLSGMAAKNFALFVYAVLKDQKKTHGKTRLVRMLREQRPFKFFNIPTEHMRQFVTEAKTHGLLYVPIRNKQKADRIEVVVFADDASKVQRIFDNLGLDVVKAQAGEATIEKAPEHAKNRFPQLLPPARRRPSKPSWAKWNSRQAALRTISTSARCSRVSLKILLPAGRRPPGNRLWKRVRSSFPHPAETLRPAQQAIKNQSKSPR